jgi:large subunit ribosomal protein L3
VIVGESVQAGARGETVDQHGAHGEATKVELPLKHTLREFRCSAEYAAKFELGQELKVDEVFSEGQFVDVRAQSRGRGFTGVMRRHNFHGRRNFRP